jgi:hypothetical protein
MKGVNKRVVSSIFSPDFYFHVVFTYNYFWIPAVVRRILLVEKGDGKRRFFRRKKQDVSLLAYEVLYSLYVICLLQFLSPQNYNSSMTQDSEHSQSVSKAESVASEEDEQLKNAATIGTSLMVVNSHRALLIL